MQVCYSKFLPPYDKFYKIKIKIKISSYNFYIFFFFFLFVEVYHDRDLELSEILPLYGHRDILAEQKQILFHVYSSFVSKVLFFRMNSCRELKRDCLYI